MLRDAPRVRGASEPQAPTLSRTARSRNRRPTFARRAGVVPQGFGAQDAGEIISNGYDVRVIRGRSALEAAAFYLRRHPEEIYRSVIELVGFRASIPVAALRWLAGEALAGASEDNQVAIETVPPGLRIGGTFDAMKTRLHAKATFFVDRVLVDEAHARIDIRLEDIEIEVLSETKTQIGALLRSGALDVSQIGDLLAELPDMPGFIVDAHGNRLSIDLMRHPTLRENPRLQEIVGLVSSLVTVRALETDPSHVGVRFRPLPRGVLEAVEQVGDHVIEPGLRLARGVLGRVKPPAAWNMMMRQFGGDSRRTPS